MLSVHRMCFFFSLQRLCYTCLASLILCELRPKCAHAGIYFEARINMVVVSVHIFFLKFSLQPHKNVSCKYLLGGTDEDCHITHVTPYPSRD